MMHLYIIVHDDTFRSITNLNEGSNNLKILLVFRDILNFFRITFLYVYKQNPVHCILTNIPYIKVFFSQL